jgi:DMSO/TMAO reductase YedYZ heme-binding membrane subunit
MTTLKTAVIPSTFALLLLIFAMVLAVQGADEDSARLLIRITAVSSLLLFSLAFSASSLNQLLADSRWRSLLRARRRLGIAFAISHSFHLVAIVALVQIAYDGDFSQLGDVAGGAVVYAFIYLMALTSNDASVRLLGARQWQWLHKTGVYLIWLALTGSYIANAMDKGGLLYWVYSALCIGLLLLRMIAFWRRRAHA